MSARYTQSKAETQKHLEILKGMLRRPENKLCADCKRNDPRWASTNLGCFMCIRCSGIHRGMGVHITRIKSVDLDTWTPEQIDNVQKWGNKRANLYWEAHLKPGHVPPEHKMESFIRSKYELRRWASQGPPPQDPSTLEGQAEEARPMTEGRHETPATHPAPASSSSSARRNGVPPITHASPPVDLFSAPPPAALPSSSTNSRRTASVPSKSTAAPPAPSSSNSLFDLDFDSPPPSYTNSARPAPPSQSSTPTPALASAPTPTPAPVKRDAKADILSLFAVAPPPRPSQYQQSQPTTSVSSGIGGLNAGLNGLSFGNDPEPNHQGFGNDNTWGNLSHGTSSLPPPVPTVHHTSFSNNGLSNLSSPPPHNAFSTTTTLPSNSSSSSSASIWGTPANVPAAATPSSSFASSKPVSNHHDPFADFGAFTTAGVPSSSSSSGGTTGSHNIWGDSTSSNHSNNGNAGGGGGGGGFSDIWA